MTYISNIEARFSDEGYRLRRLRCEDSRKNSPKDLMSFLKSRGIFVNQSQSYEPESNGLVERLVQEHWTIARVRLLATNLPHYFWGEALCHANWLRKVLTSALIDGKLPILR